jgi:SPP1 family predicted phage head-tail adaptor
MEKKPFVGQMDRKVQIVELTKTKTSTGEETTADVIVCEPFAYMEEVNGDELEEGKVIALVNRSYTVRYRSEIKAGQNKLILIDGGRRFEVNNIVEIGRKSHLKLVCRIYE